MRYNPEDANKLLKEGEVQCEIINGVDHTTADGSESLKLIIKAFDETGKSGFITSYVKHAWQIKKIFEACGMRLDKFESGEVHAQDFIGKTFTGMAKVEKSTDPRYEDKMVISKWIKADSDNGATKANEPPFFDDDIPL